MSVGLLTPGHLAVVLIVALLIFGPKRLPQTGRALGHGLREFKDAITAHHDPEPTSEPPDGHPGAASS
jgi:sec-independent protein translocase protein TatA